MKAGGMCQQKGNIDVKEKVTKGGKKERVEKSAFVQCPSQWSSLPHCGRQMTLLHPKTQLKTSL